MDEINWKSKIKQNVNSALKIKIISLKIKKDLRIKDVLKSGEIKSGKREKKERMKLFYNVFKEFLKTIKAEKEDLEENE